MRSSDAHSNPTWSDGLVIGFHVFAGLGILADYQALRMLRAIKTHLALQPQPAPATKHSTNRWRAPMTEADAESIAVRFVRGYGIAHCPVAVTAQKAEQPYGDRGPPFRFVCTTTDHRVALEFLSELTAHASRHVAMALGDDHTALINNGSNGSDYADFRWLARHLNSRFARIVNQDEYVWTNGSDRETMRYAATIFELWSGNLEPIRSVSCMNDGGRWVFHEFGPRHPVEHSFPYAARRKRDRFGSSELWQLAHAFGVPLLDVPALLNARRYYLLRDTYPEPPTCTIAEADDPAYGYYMRGMNYARHMETHATSVIADLERCLRCNPAYEPKVRETLELAHRTLNSGSNS